MSPLRLGTIGDGGGGVGDKEDDLELVVSDGGVEKRRPLSKVCTSDGEVERVDALKIVGLTTRGHTIQSHGMYLATKSKNYDHGH